MNVKGAAARECPCLCVVFGQQTDCAAIESEGGIAGQGEVFDGAPVDCKGKIQRFAGEVAVQVRVGFFAENVQFVVTVCGREIARTGRVEAAAGGLGVFGVKVARWRAQKAGKVLIGARGHARKIEIQRGGFQGERGRGNAGVAKGEFSRRRWRKRQRLVIATCGGGGFAVA
ncbi:hypothetical protein FACS1894101_0550 [Betaproteobacteria bacterium]|nr:hypothetical protein FACS1894101_0550 [Betaproteobacteria bacterium]